MGYHGQYQIQFGELPFRRAERNIAFKLKHDAVLTQNFDRVLAELEACSHSSFDTETTALDFHSDAAGFSFAIPQGKTYYSFVRHSDERILLPRSHQEKLLSVLFSKERLFLFNAGYDLRVLKHEWPGIKINAGITDVQALVYLIDTNWRMPDLKTSERLLLGLEAPHFDDVIPEQGILYADPRELCHYGAFDAYGTLAIGDMIYPELSRRYPFIVRLQEALVPILIDMEAQDLDVDYTWMQNLSDRVKAEIEEIKAQAYKDYGDINLNAPAQVSKKLLELGYDTGERTATGGMSTGKEALAKLSGVPFVDTVLSYKKKFNLVGKYVDPFLLRQIYGLPVRAHYKDNSTASWRFSSGADGKKKKKEKQKGYFMDLNFQSLPKDKAIMRRVDVDFDTMTFNFRDVGQYEVETADAESSMRKGFVAPPDHIYVSMDYKQQEIAVATNLSLEPVWLGAFKAGEDIHKMTAIAIWGKENYTKDLRKKAKTATFGVILYGGSSFTLQKKLNIPEAEADKLVIEFKKALPTLMAWIDRTHQIARRQGYVINAYGLPRRLSFYYRSGDKKLKRFADRLAINSPIQGAGACAARIFLKRAHDMIQEKYKGDVKFRLTVHDSFDFIVKKERVLEFIQDCNEEVKMTYPTHWPVPLTFDYSIGYNMAEQIPVKLVEGKLIVDSQREYTRAPDDLSDEESSGDEEE
jgi:DNA polymerase I